jgi:hypothetical protein
MPCQIGEDSVNRLGVGNNSFVLSLSIFALSLRVITRTHTHTHTQASTQASTQVSHDTHITRSDIGRLLVLVILALSGPF